jgi:ATP-dependent helicase/nuclease subunit A
VLYVACTRAENRLLLSGSASFERWPQPRPGMTPISWLAPALVPDAPSLASSEQRPSEALTVDLGSGLHVRCLFNAPGDCAEPVPAVPDEPAWQSTARAGRGVQAGACGVVAESPVSSPGPLSDPGATMSYTSLAELERCGYRYYLERVLRLPENGAAARRGEDGGVEARIRGTIVHILLESIDFARPHPPSGEDVARIARSIGVRIGAEEREEIVSLLAGALAAEPARRLASAGRARREHPFAFALDPAEPLVTGVLDLIVEQPDGSGLIVDYKSDRLEHDRLEHDRLVSPEELEPIVQRDYSIQRLIYALAAIEDGAEEVEVAHWFLERPHRWVSARFASSERHHLRELLLSRVEGARAKGFDVTESPHRGLCLTCPGRGSLCSWGETRTMSGRSATLESFR